MDTSSSNLTVRERAEVFERLEKSLSTENPPPRPSSEYTPGYLRSTASAARKFSTKRDSLGGNAERDRVKRPRLSNPSVPINRPRDELSQQRPSISSTMRSRESSVISISSQSSVAGETDHVAPEEYDESVETKRLYAKYLQYKMLLKNMDSHFPKAQQVAQKQLVTGYEALKMKNAMDLEKQEEQMAQEEEEGVDNSENKLLDHFSRVIEIMDRIDHKIENDDSIEEEKKKLSEILLYMNDINIPISKVHDQIQIVTECRELIQTIVDSTA